MYKIKEFADKSNTSITTLRYYDSIDLFKPAYTDFFTNYRYYTSEQLLKIKIINELKELDISLDDIKEYIKTNDENILQKYKEDYLDKLNKIEEIVNMKEKNNYKFEEADYKKFIELNGTKSSNTAMALELKDNNSRYFIVYKNDEYLTDFGIYKEDNLISLDRDLFKNKELLNFIFNNLIDYGYEFIITIIPLEMEDIISAIKENYKIKEEIVKQCNYKYKKIRININ